MASPRPGGTSPVRTSLRSISQFWTLFFVAALVVKVASAQTAFERTFSKSASEVQRVVDDLRESSSGRLPILEGFVEPGDQPLDRYERGYYECTFHVTPTPAGGTVVQASAKITAWYKDPSPARSGYRVLVSNGHVDNDLLDQIAEALGPNSTVNTGDASARPPSKGGSSGGLKPQINIDPPGSSAGESSSNKGTTDPLIPLHQPAATFTPATTTGESLESMKSRRAADEKEA